MNVAQVFQSLIVCGVSPMDPGAPIDSIHHPCEWVHLIWLARIVIQDLIAISTFLAIIVLMYIGFQLVTSGGDPGAKNKAKHAATSLMKGYLCLIAAWLVVYTISSALLKPGYSILGN